MPDTSPDVRSVSEITQEIATLIEDQLGAVWVCGEVSNCRRASSGHTYLTLKDEAAQLSAVAWRSTAERLGFELQDGLSVVAFGRIEVYQPRGTYQLIIQKAFPQGLGALELALRRLREKLAAEGLFDPERKRPLPFIPRRIALVTSPQGAAVRDMLQIILRRWPAADVVIVPVSVQGASAAPEIAAALSLIPHIPRVDVVITGRGGGSLEDLWAFNEEIVARAIAACPVPVISAVGHEIDVSIADFVADRRALTPSEAGEIVVPDAQELRAVLEAIRLRLIQGLRQRAERASLQLENLASRRVFTNPQQRIHQLAEQLDELSDRMTRAMRQRLETGRQELAREAAALQSLSPLNVLARGYSVTFKMDVDPSGQPQRGDLIRAGQDVEPGMPLLTVLHSGRVISRVERVLPDESHLDR